MTDSLRILANQMGVGLSDLPDAQPWSAGAVSSYAERHGNRSAPVGYAHLPDVQIASAVRMLMRDNLDHESVVCAARDRICALHVEKSEMLAALKALIECDDARKGDLQQLYERACQLARAAIAKAEAAR